MAVEYNVVLDLQATVELFQYPLHESLPEMLEINTKEKGKYVAAKARAGAGEVTLKGVASNLINDYFVLTVQGGEVLGEKVAHLVQLRPALPDTPETLSKTQRKDPARIFAISETHEELVNRTKNPNYIVEKLAKEPWQTHRVIKDAAPPAPAVPSSLPPPVPADPSAARADEGRQLEALKRVIYNARVCNLSTLQELFPAAPAALINQALSELTVPLLGRYVLRAEHFKDMAATYQAILQRLAAGNGALTLTFAELSDPEEVFMYVLGQIADKRAPRYYLRGTNEPAPQAN